MSLLNRLTKSFLKKNNMAKICFIGLDKAGKSSIIKKIINNEFDHTLDKRTLGMTVDKIKINGLSLVTWDLGGQKAFRETLWTTYMNGSQALVYVIDSSNINRLNESKVELQKYVFSNIKFNKLPILILANKQDMNNSFSAKEIEIFLDIKKFNQFNNIIIFPISCKTGLNINQAIDWLVNQINQKRFKVDKFQSPIYQPIQI